MSTLYIDESKANGYTIVAAIVVPADVAALRKDIQGLRKAGQRRLHFVKESDPRRREILSHFTRLGVTTRVYHAKGMKDAAAREACLVQLIADAVANGVTRIVIERDDSIVEFDRRIIYRELAALGMRDKIAYHHDTAAGEPLLCIPDAIAWSYARGGDWMTRARPMIAGVIRLG